MLFITGRKPAYSKNHKTSPFYGAEVTSYPSLTSEVIAYRNFEKIMASYSALFGPLEGESQETFASTEGRLILIRQPGFTGRILT